MNFYEELQLELATRLNAWFDSHSLIFKAVTMPDTEKDFQALNEKYRETPLVIVKHNESTFRDSDSNNHVTQDEVLQMSFVFLNSKAKGEEGVYNQFENLKLSMLGYNPEKCSRRLTFSKYVPVEWEGLGICNTAYMITERPVIQLDDEELILGEQFKRLTVTE